MKSDGATQTVKFLCSYGGKILPRHTDGKLRYVGGLTRVLAVDRSISFAELMMKLLKFCGSSMTLKCQLPTGDLETLISITSDEDLGTIVEEYDRASSSLSHPLKIRAVLMPPKSLKQISPPSSSAPSVKAVDSLPNSPPYSFVDRTSSPKYGFIRRNSPPPISYNVGGRNCSGMTCYYPCHITFDSGSCYNHAH